MDLFKEQQEIELSMVNRGIERYQRLALEAAKGGEATRTKSVQVVLDTAVDALTGAVDEFIAAASSGKAGRRHSAVALLAGISSQEASLIALRLILDGIAQDRAVTPTACSVGRALELEARMNKLEETEGGYVRTLMKDLDSRTDHLRHRRAVLSRVLRTRGDKWTAWTERDHLLLGLKLIELAATSTGLLEVANTRSGNKSLAIIRATPRFRDWLFSLDQQFSLLSPSYLPCVIPPKEWTSFEDGGYHTDALAFPPRLVKTSNREHRKLLAKADLSKVLSAVNAIQRTPWAINSRLLETAEALWAGMHPIAGLPDPDDVPLPAKPEDMDTNEEARTEWKRAAARTYDANRRTTGRRVGVLRNLHTAREFAHYERIYFPYQLDFRGRVYPIPQGLNPQGSDLGKALLHFADGDALDTTSAIHWFKVHGANCFGIDKVSFDDRMAWVDENAEHIIRSAEDPIGYQWWADADSPFCFLAWAFEFNDWLKSGCSRGFVSRIPVAMDGSCNGLQHYSAMLRDSRSGMATNLLPSDKPQDIYGEVANVVTRKLSEIVERHRTGWTEPGKATEEAAQELLMATEWLRFGIDRKITKRPVMVLPYGGTIRSCMDYVLEAVKERHDLPFADDTLPKASAWLAGIVWESIGEVVVSARLAMGWLKTAASKIAKGGGPIVWETPVGFPVVQAYPEMSHLRVDTFLMGARFAPALQVQQGDKIDARRQASGIAPNFVHSLDAAALMETVNLAASLGVERFAMIHDSYGTTAGRAGLLAASLRRAFVSMYEENDVLEQFNAKAVVPSGASDVPGIPFVGGLDLKEVEKSQYFFA